MGDFLTYTFLILGTFLLAGCSVTPSPSPITNVATQIKSISVPLHSALTANRSASSLLQKSPPPISKVKNILSGQKSDIVTAMKLVRSSAQEANKNFKKITILQNKNISLQNKLKNSHSFDLEIIVGSALMAIGIGFGIYFKSPLISTLSIVVPGIFITVLMVINTLYWLIPWLCAILLGFLMILLVFHYWKYIKVYTIFRIK